MYQLFSFATFWLFFHGTLLFVYYRWFKSNIIDTIFCFVPHDRWLTEKATPQLERLQVVAMEMLVS